MPSSERKVLHSPASTAATYSSIAMSTMADLTRTFRVPGAAPSVGQSRIANRAPNVIEGLPQPGSKCVCRNPSLTFGALIGVRPTNAHSSDRHRHACLAGRRADGHLHRDAIAGLHIGRHHDIDLEQARHVVGRGAGVLHGSGEATDLDRY